MECPKCSQPDYTATDRCARCQFQGDSAAIEQLNHVRWILDEIDTWDNTAQLAQDDVRQRYKTQRDSLEIKLGLRKAIVSADQARQIWLKRYHQEVLLGILEKWHANRWLNAKVARQFISSCQEQIRAYTEQLQSAPSPDTKRGDVDRLATITTVIETATSIKQLHGFSTPEIETKIFEALCNKKEEIEINLGLRTHPKIEEITIVEPEPQISASTPPSKPVEQPSPQQSRAPLHERIWKALLTERTLHAILFLGIFLLFSAAISFVIWGWRDFSPLLRVIIPSGFTAAFFALGRYVRTKTDLRRSEIALSAIAALLIPIDLYTIYTNYGKPPTYWAEFWFAASVVCLFAYGYATQIIRSRFFGYLVGTAAGSLVLASIEVAHQRLGLSRDWYSAGLSVLALAMIVFTSYADRWPASSRWRIYIAPFRYLALSTIAVVMPLSFGWRFLDRNTYDVLHYALATNWLIGSLIIGWGAITYQSHSLGILTVITTPIAIYLTQAGIFDLTGTNSAWHAFGLAWLVPIYFSVGYRLLKGEKDTVHFGFGQTLVRWGVVLLAITAFWALTDLTSGAAAANTHAVLAGSVILATLLWQRPWFLYLASAFKFSTVTFALSEFNIPVEQLGIGWISLGIMHMLFALYIGNRTDDTYEKFAKPLVLAAYVIAALALLPSLFPYNESISIYVLGNWIGMAAWGAYLSHRKQPGFVIEQSRIESVFHWLSAIPIPFWVWIVFSNQRPPDFTFPLALTALAWGMVFLGHRLARINERFRRPWRLTGLLVSLAALFSAYAIIPEGFTPAICLILVGLLYFCDAFVARTSIELAPAGLLTAWGLIRTLQLLRVEVAPQLFLLAILTLLQEQRFRSV